MALTIALLGAVGVRWPGEVGLMAGGSLVGRLSHPLVHAGFLHAAMNVYVLWQLVFFFPIRLRHLVAAYLLACCCPVTVAVWSIFPTATEEMRVVGLSGVDYALMGWIMPTVARRLRFNVTVVVWQLAGMAVGSVAVGLHLWCYVLGAILSCFRR